VNGTRGLRTTGKLAVAIILLAWVWFAPFSTLGTANLALIYTLIAVSLVLLTGWVGQISLAQASFVGIGAFMTGVVTRGGHLPFPLTLPLAMFISGGAAALLGLVALRVRGLYLAVATMIFAWVVQEYVFNQPWIAGVGGSSVAPIRPLGVARTIPYLDYTDRRTFYFVLLAATVTAIVALANLRDSKTGRAWFAVKGSEIAAASLGIAVTRYKLIAFAVSGAIAGGAGSLLMTHKQVATAAAFAPAISLFYLAIAVVGGLDSLGGAISSAVLFALLEEVFYRVSALAGLLQIVSALLLALVLLFFPSGVAGFVGPIRRRARQLALVDRLGLVASRARTMLLARVQRFRAADPEQADQPEPEREPRDSRIRRLMAPLTARRSQRRIDAPDALAPALPVEFAPKYDGESLVPGLVLPVSPAVTVTYVPGHATRPDLPARDQRPPILVARDITVRFGGLVAVDGAHLEVRSGEIVGLIGPNGAGKTTLFNAISGLNEPTAGRVELFGTDVTSRPVHERAALGMGRTFQMIQLFPQLTVFDNLLVATHVRNPTGMADHMCATRTGVEEERAVRRRVRRVISMLTLEEVADRLVTGLPFGVLRMVEVARALVTGAPFIMLDEPASGLDNKETDRLADLLLWVRQALGVALLLIEHDVRLVTSVTDYIYVIDRGRPIAEGTPEEVQRDPAVVAAYLGRPADTSSGSGQGSGQEDASRTGATL
jgi:sulfate-transporting ATPase